MNLGFFIKLLLGIWLSFVTLSSYATGPSSARIFLKPLTYNGDGVVLFKAYQTIDYWGAPSDRKFSYFWLAVSSNGIWEETPHKILKQPEYNNINAKKSLATEERKQADFWKTVDFFYEEFASDLDWGHPPKSLLPLIRKYGFKSHPGFNENVGQGSVTWSSKSLCMNGRCIKPAVPQCTLGKRFSSEAYTTVELKGEEIIDVENKPIQNIFYHAGVALFRNGNYKIANGKYEQTNDTDDEAIGATFDFYKKSMGEQIIDLEYVDAISIVPKHILKPPSLAPAKR